MSLPTSDPSGDRNRAFSRGLGFGGVGGALVGKVALVAGGTRGAGRGIAVELGAAGATVYVTGRTTSTERSEMDRPETIEETAELVDAAGGKGIAVQVDHLVPEQVAALVERIRREAGALHVLVNDIFGAPIEWNKPVWESTLDVGLHTLRLAVDTHAITSHFALPLLLEAPGSLVVEVNDGTDEYNASHYRNSFFYDLAKASVGRMAFALAHELEPLGATAVSLTPGWLRSEAMLEAFEVTEATWRDATERIPHFAISETPAFVGRAVAALAQDPDLARWSGQSLSSGQLAKVYGFTDLDGSQPDCWRYLVEVQEAGRPADGRLPLTSGRDGHNECCVRQLSPVIDVHLGATDAVDPRMSWALQIGARCELRQNADSVRSRPRARGAVTARRSEPRPGGRGQSSSRRGSGLWGAK